MARRRVTAAAALSAATLILTACSGPDLPDWVAVSAPIPGEAVTATVVGQDLLVGSYDANAPVRPQLSLVALEGGVRRIPVRPAPGYGDQARWLAVVAHGAEVTAVGGARGGAHANVRWTEWSGGVDGIRDLPQEFGTFGGWGMGDLIGAAQLDGEPVIIGSWASARTGLDIAVWELEGEIWRRQSSAGTPLEGTPEQLVSATGVATRGSDLVVVGSTTELSPDLPIRPAAWLGARASDGRIEWRRASLPKTVGASIDAVGCQPADTHSPTCLFVGRRAGRLMAWVLDGDAADPSEVDLAELTLSDADTVLTPAWVHDRWWVAVQTASSGRYAIGRDDEWTEVPVPDGSPRALAAGEDGLWIVLQRDGATQLWRPSWANR